MNGILSIRQTTAHTALARVVAACLLACLLVTLAACSGSAGTETPATGASFDPPEKVAMPVISEDAEAIDTAHVNDGYVVVRATIPSRLKFQVSKGDAVYNYDLPSDGTPTVYPINMGDGAYLFRIMENIEGNNYAEADRAEAQVKLTSEYAPFLLPNLFCDFDEKSACVAKGRELCKGAENQGEAAKAICDYVVQNISYDSAKAQKLSTEIGYVPDPDETLSSGKGVCFDYASLGAAMLRSEGFPTKIITGYVSPGDLYHAWIMVYVDGSWKTAEFSVDPETWSRVDLTFAASGNSEYTGDGTSYVERYVY